MKRFSIILPVLLTALLFYACTGGENLLDETTTEPSEPETTSAPEIFPEQEREYMDYTKFYSGAFKGQTSPALAESGGEIIVADVTLDTENIALFSNGYEGSDCSAAIQNAIYTVYNAGGGTVYLHAGVYTVGSPILIKPFVTLAGSWPDTVIAAVVAPSDNELPALFTVGGSGGVRDLTVYYPEQDIDDAKSYPFTFYIPGVGEGADYANYMLPCIFDVTVINGYRGIVASKYDNWVNEQITISDFRGTFLHTGLELYNSADASVIRDVEFSPSVWSDFRGELYGFAPSPSKDRIATYTIEHTSAYIIGDLEWSQWQNLSADSCLYGLHTVKGFRTRFSGIYSIMFRLQIAPTV